MKTLTLAAFLLLFGLNTCYSHDTWGNGEPVPAWVKKYCCGPEDVHHLRNDQVITASDGYHIVGTPIIVPYKDALPSPDNSYWAFFRVNTGSDGSQTFSPVYCMFVPPQSF